MMGVKRHQQFLFLATLGSLTLTEPIASAYVDQLSCVLPICHFSTIKLGEKFLLRTVSHHYLL